MDPELTSAATGSEFEHPELGCSLNTGYDRCYGSQCYADYECNTGCCWGYGYYNNYCNYNCDYNSLAWLWWTLSCLFLCMCIMSMIGAAKRRQR